VNRVWYVAYGSNIGSDRFRCYLAGGRPYGGARTFNGCRDPSDPTETFSVELPGALVFAGESGVWGGGMAFFDPEGTSSVACRAHLLTAEQFADVVAQEMRLSPGGDFALALERVLPEVEALHSMGPGRYETVVRVGTRDRIPLLTVTNGDVRELVLASPSAPYLRSIATGLREAHGWDDTRIATYLASAPGAIGSWTSATVLESLETDRVGRPDSGPSPSP
jgi:hypothetical protein